MTGQSGNSAVRRILRRGSGENTHKISLNEDEARVVAAASRFHTKRRACSVASACFN
ncbi:Uncharacterised protein [Bordetella pertussis]|nr:Uncharacterised protein [Bordetella pertussis]